MKPRGTPRLSLRAESRAVLRRVDEAEDHVPKVGRIVCQSRHPVVEAYRVGVASQVSKVLHRDKRADEKLVGH